MLMQDAGQLRAALLAVIGGQGRGFRDPGAGELFSAQAERVLRATEQIAALRLVDTRRAVSWLSEPSQFQLQWIRQALGWAPPSPPPLQPLVASLLALSIAAAAAARSAPRRACWPTRGGGAPQ